MTGVEAGIEMGRIASIGTGLTVQHAGLRATQPPDHIVLHRSNTIDITAPRRSPGHTPHGMAANRTDDAGTASIRPDARHGPARRVQTRRVHDECVDHHERPIDKKFGLSRVSVNQCTDKIRLFRTRTTFAHTETGRGT